MKLWELKSSVGMLSALPAAEFFDQETSVTSVCLEPSQGLYLAAGSIHGHVIIWETAHLTVAGTLEVGVNR